MNPKHLKQVPDDRKAIAPYNFVELPNKVVPAQVECNGKLRDNDRYYCDRHTGKIICTLKTESPLYIRCGLTPVDFATFGDTPNEELKLEQRKKKAEFFVHPSNLHPVLPGSSLRGMLRTLVEIISFSKIEKVSDQQKFFFRAVVADKDDPLSKPYKNRLKNVKAGYLEFEFDKKQKQNKWFVRPAQEIEGQLFMEVMEEDIQDDLPSLILMKKADYIPQYIQISFEVTAESINVSEDLTRYSQQGWLVTSGNMLENMLEKTTERKREELLRKKEGRKYHYIIGKADRSARQREISPDAIRDYRDALTNFQKGKEKPFKDNPKNRFDEKMGVLQPNIPIFYCEPQNEQQIVTLFGQSPNFRIPYSPNNDGQAASAVNFIPKAVGESDRIDLADAIFGFVRGKKDKTVRDATEKVKDKREQSRAGRIFVSDAQYDCDEDGIWLTDGTITPEILASPKPTTFQHYLVQPEDTKAVKSQLKHYGKPITETVIRGHKLYWHKGNVNQDRIKADATEAEIEEKRSQYTDIKPIKSGVSFNFAIHFENLTDVELGALLWILTLAGDDTEKLNTIDLNGKEKYRLSLGMGKPLGMGAVAIEYKLILNKRYKNEPKQRYTQLFDGEEWVTSDRAATAEEQQRFLTNFENYIVNHISIGDCPKNFPIEENREALHLKDVPRIKMLLTMLRWDVFPPVTTTRYMEIERDREKDYLCQLKEGDKTVNEYKCRLVLPTPFQVMDKVNEDNRRCDNSPPPSNQSSQNEGNSGNSNAATRRPPKKPKF